MTTLVHDGCPRCRWGKTKSITRNGFAHLSRVVGHLHLHVGKVATALVASPGVDCRSANGSLSAGNIRWNIRWNIRNAVR
eukprot:133772-Prorocentrum_minimum.AAC.1